MWHVTQVAGWEPRVFTGTAGWGSYFSCVIGGPPREEKVRRHKPAETVCRLFRTGLEATQYGFYHLPHAPLCIPYSPPLLRPCLHCKDLHSFQRCSEKLLLPDLRTEAVSTIQWSVLSCCLAASWERSVAKLASLGCS